MSKIGLHIVPGARNGYGRFLEQVAANPGGPLIVKCVDDFSPAREARIVLGARAYTMGRRSGQGWEGLDVHPQGGTRPEAVVELHFTQVYLPAIKAAPWIDVWEPSNEWAAYPSWQADFYLLLARYFEEEGKSMGVFGCSTGNPPESWFTAIARCCKGLRERNAGHILTTHEYGGVATPVKTLRDTEPYHALRFEALYRRLALDDAVIPLVISEAGQNAGGPFIGTRDFIDDFAWYDAHLMRFDYVIGACAWTLGNWGGANFQEALPDLADYIVAHPLPEPEIFDSFFHLPAVQRNIEEGAPVTVQDVLAALAALATLGAGAWMIRRRISAQARRKGKVT